MNKIVETACRVGLAFLAFAGGTARAERLETLEFGIESGYRIDELDWNIAGSLAGTNPNILSELSWEDVEIYQLGASGKLAVGNEHVDFLTYIRGAVNYGWIKDGDWRDSDFHGDHRALEFSRSIGAAEDDNVFDASIGLGFQWKVWQDRLAIAPLGGYSYHQQDFRNTMGVQLVAVEGFGVSPVGTVFSALDTTYETEW